MICLGMALFNWTEAAECVGRVLKASHSSDTDRSAMEPIVSAPRGSGAGVAFFSSANSKDRDTTGAFPSACAALNVAEIWRPLRRMLPLLLSAVTMSLHSRRVFVIVEFCFMKKFEREN